ncbi:hypothetical protein MCC93_19230 [Morococcus cerebrosus]|jgi:hypothetical protein|uniref:Uncharacterized protein n=1 Tax=Morococcus cerebrosus TaxID=1056807 RepID=A0A0C1E451_9NEIS|nr:hypothetical protein MCC93_19230 [Morococcus cerebrosus]
MHWEMLFLGWKTLLLIQNIGICFLILSLVFQTTSKPMINESHAAIGHGLIWESPREPFWLNPLEPC